MSEAGYTDIAEAQSAHEASYPFGVEELEVFIAAHKKSGRRKKMKLAAAN